MINSVGLIGVGSMGAPMAACMASAGFDVVLYDIDSSHAETVAARAGARVASSLTELGMMVPIAITMLPNSRAVSNALFGEEDGLAKGLAAGKLVIDMSSGDPNATIAMADRLAEQGVRMIDAPVSGGVWRAESGDLMIMTGGDPEVAREAAAVLCSMGEPTHVGILGAGQAMKALNNLVAAGGFLIGIEALLIGQKFGLNPGGMVDILNASSGMNSSTQRKFKQFVLSRNFDGGGFAIGLMAKDVGIATDLARSTDTPAPFSTLCSQMWASAAKMLGPDADHTAIARMSEMFAGTKLSESTGDNDVIK